MRRQRAVILFVAVALCNIWFSGTLLFQPFSMPSVIETSTNASASATSDISSTTLPAAGSDDATKNTRSENDDERDLGDEKKEGMFDFLSPLPNRHFNTTLKDTDIAYVPRQYEEADVRMDDLSAGGKSCVWDYLRDHRWLCQDCSSDDDDSVCRGPLAIRDITKVTPEFKFEWDEPPRLSSSLNPLTSSAPSDRILTMFASAYGPSYQNMECDTSVLEWPCFDLERCFPKDEDSVSEEGSQRVLTIYMHDRRLGLHVGNFPPQIRNVSDPSTACLVVASDESFGSDEYDYFNMIGADSWKGGQNHFLWASNRFFGHNEDLPCPMFIHFEFAAIGLKSMTDVQFRRDFDVALTFRAQQIPPDDAADRVRDVEQHRPKLLSFKGKFLPWGQPFHYHRWIAAEYWDLDVGDVMLDIYAESGKESYDSPESQFMDFLLDATFVFCPGGQSPGSYRFLESLLAGAIPVVITSFVAPLEPEVDWSGCLVRVSEARVIDLPAILRRIPHEEIVRRRVECRVLWETLEERKVGEKYNDGVDLGFTASLILWHHRIGRAKRRRERRKTLRQSILQHSKEGRRRQQRRRLRPISSREKAAPSSSQKSHVILYAPSWNQWWI